MNPYVDQALRRAGMSPDLPRVQMIGIRQDRASYVVYDADGRRRVAHVKIARSEQARQHLAAEYVTLSEVADAFGLLGRLPAPRAWWEADGTAVSVVTAMPGRRLDVVQAQPQPTSARKARRDVGRVRSWLDALHEHTASGFEEVDVDRACYALRYAGTPHEEIARWRALVTEHGGLHLPKVLTHGDLWPGNILVDQNGHVAVVDWETAATKADPYDDLLFFLLTYMRGTLPGAPSLADAVTACLLGGSRWRTELVTKQLTSMLDRDGVPPALSGPVILRFLARRAMGSGVRADGRPLGAGEWPRALERFVKAEHMFADNR